MQIYVPRVSATFSFQGSTRRFVRGRTTIEEGHPILKGREHMVEPLRIDYPLPEQKVRPGTGSRSRSGSRGASSGGRKK